MQYFRAISKTAGGTGNGGYPSPNGAPVPPPWLFPIWSNGGGGYLTVSPTYIAFDLTGNGIARINVGTGPHQQWSGNSINPAGTYLDPNSYLGPYDAALRAEAVSQNESGLYVYSAGPLVPQIQQTVVRSGTCPLWNFPANYPMGSFTATITASAGYTITPTSFSVTDITFTGQPSNSWGGGSPNEFVINCSGALPPVSGVYMVNPNFLSTITGPSGFNSNGTAYCYPHTLNPDKVPQITGTSTLYTVNTTTGLYVAVGSITIASG